MYLSCIYQSKAARRHFSFINITNINTRTFIDFSDERSQISYFILFIYISFYNLSVSGEIIIYLIYFYLLFNLNRCCFETFRFSIWMELIKFKNSIISYYDFVSNLKILLEFSVSFTFVSERLLLLYFIVCCS